MSPPKTLALVLLSTSALAASCTRPSPDPPGLAPSASAPRGSAEARSAQAPPSAPAEVPSGTTPLASVSSPAGPATGSPEAGGCEDLGVHPASSLPPLPPMGPEMKGVLRGVDTSTPSAWKQLAGSGARFAMVQAVYGKNRTASFADNWAMARRCGVPRGAYHFLSPQADGAGQGAAFLAQLGGDLGELSPSVDVELPAGCKGPCCEVSCEGWQAAVSGWLGVVEKAIGRPAMVYTVEDFWKQCLCNTSRFALRPLWLAGYPRFDFPPRPGFGGWQRWALYQHKGNVRFGSGVIDLDVVSGGEEGLARLMKTP